MSKRRWANDLSVYFTLKDHDWRINKRCFTSSAIMKIQIEMTVRCHL